MNWSTNPFPPPPPVMEVTLVDGRALHRLEGMEDLIAQLMRIADMMEGNVKNETQEEKRIREAHAVADIVGDGSGSE